MLKAFYIPKYSIQRSLIDNKLLVPHFMLNVLCLVNKKLFDGFSLKIIFSALNRCLLQSVRFVEAILLGFDQQTAGVKFFVRFSQVPAVEHFPFRQSLLYMYRSKGQNRFLNSLKRRLEKPSAQNATSHVFLYALSKINFSQCFPMYCIR